MEEGTQEGKSASARGSHNVPLAPIIQVKESKCAHGGLGLPETFTGEGLKLKTLEIVIQSGRV